MLDDVSILPIDHETITAAFHEHGINMRYLSYVCVLSTPPHIKEICITEMLARTIKNIMNSSTAKLILDNENQKLLVVFDDVMKHHFMEKAVFQKAN